MLVDSHNRKIDYLRISVTDRCNLRCIYCMPECGIINKPHQELLSFEEVAEIVKAAVALGINKIRLTGGEPLVRKDIVNLVKSLSSIKGIEDLSMTTNGVLLKDYAFALKKAGLKRLNISLDTLDEARYKFITRLGNLSDVWAGLETAIKAGFSPLKINVLLLGSINKDEVINFLKLTLKNSLHIRFLEFMPVNNFFQNEDFISGSMILEIARGFSEFQAAEVLGFGPAKIFRFKNALGTFGLIAPLSDKFCSNCNRLRLTSDGFLKSCLHANAKVNLRDALRSGINQRDLVQLIERAVELKPREHAFDRDSIETQEYLMCQIGG